MAEDLLAPSGSSFDQDRNAWVAGSDTTPGASRIEGLRVLALRHLPGSGAVVAALRAIGFEPPAQTGDVSVSRSVAREGYAVRRQPEETLIVTADGPSLEPLLTALAPGRNADAHALDLGHGTAVISLDGPRLDEWLSHLVDALSVPRRSGRAARVRLADVAVLLIRVSSDRVWVVADRALCPYLADWLSFTHRGAFGGGTGLH